MFGRTRHLEFLVVLGLLLGELGEPHPAYILHLKRTLLADREFSSTVSVFAAAFQLERSVRQDMSNRLMSRHPGSLESKVRVLRSMWAEARELKPQRYEEVLQCLADTKGLSHSLDELKAAWTTEESAGNESQERQEVTKVCNRLLLRSPTQRDPGSHH